MNPIGGENETSGKTNAIFSAIVTKDDLLKNQMFMTLLTKSKKKNAAETASQEKVGKMSP